MLENLDKAAKFLNSLPGELEALRRENGALSKRVAALEGDRSRDLSAFCDGVTARVEAIEATTKGLANLLEKREAPKPTEPPK